jgi:hypothetical protein
MATIDLGQGGRLESLVVTPSFPGAVGRANFEIPDKLFPDIKGTLRYSAGAILDARTVGTAAMGATATGIIRSNGFIVGFKQVAFFKLHTALFAGIKDSDGCIEETSTGLNFRQFLDCSPDDNLQAPWAPFYLPRTLAQNGKPFKVEMLDQPGGRLRLQRRNAKRDRLNFLLALRTSCDFVTYFVVERPDGSHLPIQGFAWNCRREIDIAWDKGNPTIARNVGGAVFDSLLDNLKPGDARFDILANNGLRSPDTLVSQFNQGLFAASNRKPSASYSITEFDNYTENITPALQSRLGSPV